ncbi:hypothetical protein HYALB_00003005 [Hymenoscyphus albidus]|uniref:Uncharacterized protein n=1 Tax=Hymenoscyphus albidus TaxID=595503 RepID=A0A9N9M240_9HELO|nr:hypothetical protein HYALB_00003005 [Hymenoscyphus albidus]
MSVGAPELPAIAMREPHRSEYVRCSLSLTASAPFPAVSHCYGASRVFPGYWTLLLCGILHAETPKRAMAGASNVQQLEKRGRALARQLERRPAIVTRSGDEGLFAETIISDQI